VGSRDGDDRYQAGDPAGAGRSQSGDGESDLIEIGGHPRLWPWLGARGTTAGIALAALAVGLLLGFAAGRHTGGAKARPAPRTTEKTAVAVPLIGDAGIIFTGNRCAVQHGRTLQLGIEIDNQSGSTITINRIRSKLPLGGLRQISSEVGACGSVTVPGGSPVTTVAAGTSTWLTATFAVKVRCPAPLPVLFVVDYAISKKAASVYYEGFPDLGPVPYTGCRART